MGYTVALSNSATQAEGSPGGTAAKFTFTLTREAGDNSETAYSYEIRHADTLVLANTASGSNTVTPDFAALTLANLTNGTAPGGTADSGTFSWTAGQNTLTISIEALADATIEGSESFVVWFFRDTAGHQRFNDGLSFNHTSTITLTNDDADPVFSSAASFSAAENQTAVGTVAATGGGTVAYTVTGGADAARFQITDPATGVLTFQAAPNAEAPGDLGGTAGDGIFVVQVTATAAGRSTVQTINVTLTNVNEDPVITTNGGADVAVNVAENNSTTFATVAATTGDLAAANDTVTYSLSGGADSSFFTIDPTSGALRFTTGRSFETRADSGADNIYNVQVRATDSGGLFDTINYAVTVTDLVEPAIISSNGGADTAFIFVAENSLGAFTTVAATDDDTAGAMVYSIAGGADGGRFTIDGATGALSFTASPNYEAPTDANTDNLYEVTVQAAVAGGGADTQQLNVFVTNVIESGVPSDVPPANGGGPVVPPPPVNVNDLLTGTAGTDSRAGGEGNDTINGDAGDDQLDGDNGGDLVYGGQGNDFIRGLNDNDTVYGDEGADTVNGNIGDDVVDGGSGDDTVYGGQGQDTVYGGEGNDVYVNGNIGNDVVHGGIGDDSVYGGQNSDTVHGDAGNDRVTGDLGNDILHGEAGADRFVMLNTGGDDWVADWNFAEGDRIQLANGQAYTVSNVGGQAFISLGPTAGIGLAGVSFSSFSSDWIIFGA